MFRKPGIYERTEEMLLNANTVKDQDVKNLQYEIVKTLDEYMEGT